MGITTRTQISRENTEFYDRALLRRAVPLFIHAKFAQVRDIPRNGGTNVIKFRRYGALSAATTPLTEGITPAGSSLAITDLTATVLPYGDYVTLTDVVDYESKDPVLTETAQILGEQAANTLDLLTRDVLSAGTTIQYAASRAGRDSVASTDKLSVTEVRKAVKTLKNNLARKITMMVDPSTGIATIPLNACYVGLIHPSATYDLKADSAFIPVEKYASTRTIMEGEIGALDEVRFVESTNAKVFTGAGASSIDVYSTVILGADAYGMSRISGEALKNIVKPLGSGGSTDPLDQRATSGWKATFVAKILNDSFMLRIEHAVT